MGKLVENAGFVPWDSLPVRVGRDPTADLPLTENTVSRWHAWIGIQDGLYWVRDFESRYGTFVNGVQIRQRQLRPGDQIRFGQKIIYTVEADGLRRIETGGLGLSARGLEIAVGERVLVSLNTWVWEIPPSRLVGILGPSGAGKSMLLRTLAGIRPPSKGTIACGALTDVWQQIDAYRSELGYIPQDDVVLPLLTLRENLYFTAQLRLGDRLDWEELQERIEDALDLFGLKEHMLKPAGVLSGGQRKRLSIAMEWLRQPKILFLDEPTSGLDPANEARLMENLVQVARRGSTIVCTTHLMENIRLWDEVLVLGICGGRGTAAYAGPPEHLLPSLQCRHFADLYEKLERGKFQPIGLIKPSSGSSNIQQQRTGPAPPTRQATELLGRMPAGERNQAWSAAPASTDRPTPSFQQFHEPPAPLYRLALSSGKLFDGKAMQVVAHRSALNLWRDRWMRWIILGQPIILALVVALTQFSPGKLLGLLFFTTVVACWLGMNNSIRDLVRDRRTYIRDRLGGLSPGSYLLAKGAVYAAIGAGQLAVFLLLVRLTAPFVMPEEIAEDLAKQPLLIWWLWLELVYGGGLALAMIVSTLVSSEEAAVAWLPILILPQILLSATGTGVSPLEYTDPRPFRPIAITLQHPLTETGNPRAPGSSPSQERKKIGAIALIADALSLGLVCRPGVLLVERPRVAGFSPNIWLADLCHLLLLLLSSILGLWLVFRQQERYWPALVGY